MSEATHHAGDALLRQCVGALDRLYSCTSNRDHLTILNTAVEKLLQDQFKNFESFRAELSCMNDPLLSTLKSSNKAGMVIFNEEEEEEERARLGAEGVEREKAEEVNQATSSTDGIAPTQATSSTPDTLTSTCVDAAVQLEPTTATTNVFEMPAPMDGLPNVITNGPLTEAIVQ
ncbi:uncharacterized protein ATC70_008349 [Mucor velutinosus]|uniref:Uncharacterized protein n=1 Tax=Mucor velutinosus TaxID=708070 RepID=A0AAN7DN56_9FUNG|nr:hypothetical protein ATC70_008349 [Mucor velutinosus]